MKKVKNNPTALHDLLFEIGCEELPATSLADIFEGSTPADNSFSEKLKRLLADQRISFKDCRVWVTPRRLVFYVTEVSPSQTARDQMTKVLSKDDSYTPDGKPTEKILNILKHRGVSIEETVIADLNGKPFVYIRKAELCEKTEKILHGLFFETLVKSLHFPKNMKWDESGMVFSRPIRSCMGILGDKILRFKIGSVSSSVSTRLFLKGKRITVPIKDIESYFKVLRKYGVILDQALRKEVISKALKKASFGSGARLYDDPFLLNEVNYLVEIPHILAAPFGGKFLELPLEVLAVSMARKQRIFSMQGKNSFELEPSFLAVLDGSRSKAEEKVISKNIENILQAKLQDSLFFYQEDAKVGLDRKREELKNLVFLKGAGSMLEKSDRLVRLAKKIAPELKLSTEQEKGLEQAAYLCKTDLLTQMVGEFPELQGVMGSYYAKKSGKSDETTTAIRDQYLPRTAQDRLPQFETGALLSILDKTDLIVACFGLGLEPTSSADPYGLRRSALAIFKILLDRKLGLSFKNLIEQSRSELRSFILKDREAALASKLDAFFKDRFKAVLADKGLPEDFVDAVSASGFERPYEVYQRVEALSAVAGEEYFRKAQKIIERTANILKGVKEALPERIDPSIFIEDLEKTLFTAYENSVQAIAGAQARGDWSQATSLYGEAFFDILNQFFEKVFINTEDTKVRVNRLLLLKTVKELYTKNIADLSHLKHAAG